MIQLMRVYRNSAISGNRIELACRYNGASLIALHATYLGS